MKVKEVIVKHVGKFEVYPNGTNVCIIDKGKIYTTCEYAFKALKFSNTRYNDADNYDGIWTVKGKLMHSYNEKIMYHITKGIEEILISEDGINEYIQTITIEGKTYNKEEVIKRLSELETVG